MNFLDSEKSEFSENLTNALVLEITLAMPVILTKHRNNKNGCKSTNTLLHVNGMRLRYLQTLQNKTKVIVYMLVFT